MVSFIKSQEYNIYKTSAVHNGEVVAEFRFTSSAIDNGIIEVYAGEIPLVVALWIINHGYTNHGWFEISQGAIYQCEIDRYRDEERRWRVATIRV